MTTMTPAAGSLPQQAQSASEGSLPPRRAPRFSGFDGLRAWGAAAVILWHVAIFLPLGWFYLSNLLVQVRAFVEMFFIVSGFLVYRPFVAAHLDGRPVTSIKRFYSARALRILPAYWAALLFATYVLRATQIRGPRDWIIHLFFLQVLSRYQYLRGIGVAWSISVEVGFYLLLPLLAWSARRLGRRSGAVPGELMMLGAFVAVGGAYQLGAALIGARLAHQQPPFFFPTFALGMLLALANVLTERRGRPTRAEQLVIRHGGLCWLASIAALALMALRYNPTSHFYEVFVFEYHTTDTVAMFLLVLPLAVAGAQRTFMRWVLDNRVAVYLGTISYGIYIWHYQLVAVMRDYVFRLLTFQGNVLELYAAVFIPTVIAASASWFLIEQPCTWLRHGRATALVRFRGPAGRTLRWTSGVTAILLVVGGASLVRTVTPAPHPVLALGDLVRYQLPAPGADLPVMVTDSPLPFAVCPEIPGDTTGHQPCSHTIGTSEIRYGQDPAHPALRVVTVTGLTGPAVGFVDRAAAEPVHSVNIDGNLAAATHTRDGSPVVAWGSGGVTVLAFGPSGESGTTLARHASALRPIHIKGPIPVALATMNRPAVVAGVRYPYLVLAAERSVPIAPCVALFPVQPCAAIRTAPPGFVVGLRGDGTPGTATILGLVPRSVTRVRIESNGHGSRTVPTFGGNDGFGVAAFGVTGLPDVDTKATPIESSGRRLATANVVTVPSPGSPWISVSSGTFLLDKTHTVPYRVFATRPGTSSSPGTSEGSVRLETPGGSTSIGIDGAQHGRPGAATLALPRGRWAAIVVVPAPTHGLTVRIGSKFFLSSLAGDPSVTGVRVAVVMLRDQRTTTVRVYGRAKNPTDLSIAEPRS